MTDDNKFISEVSCIKSLGVENYLAILNDSQAASLRAQNAAKVKLAQPVNPVLNNAFNVF